MKDKAAEQFLEQFDASRRQLANWPSWMKESAKVATASLPSVTKATFNNTSQASRKENQTKS